MNIMSVKNFVCQINRAFLFCTCSQNNCQKFSIGKRINSVNNCLFIRSFTACDIFNPKVIRASMGAIFSLHIKRFKSFEEYYQAYQGYECYPFMLKGAKNIHHVHTNNLHALIFGNESSGLDDSFLNYGQSVFIPHTSKIDSLNLSQSLGIGLYHFSSAQFEDKTSLR